MKFYYLPIVFCLWLARPLLPSAHRFAYSAPSLADWSDNANPLTQTFCLAAWLWLAVVVVWAVFV